MIGKDLFELGPLYHSYRIFGANNEQLGGIFPNNQMSKETIIFAYIMFALAKCREKISTPVTFAELFCADGYYAIAARKFGASKTIGIDNNRDGYLCQGEKIVIGLGLDGIQFIEMDVNDIDQMEPVDIVANVGGLYHVDNPEAILDKSYNFARRFLIVQTVVSLVNDDEAYYESPAPGWTWGNRFSRRSFENLIIRKGWHIIDRHFNELEGNDRLEDRGSAYFLIEKK